MTLHIPDFSSARVLIAGDVMLDRYWQGSTARISPEAPVPVVRVESNEERPGGAGNVALNVAALGPQVTLAGLVGNDEAATALQRLLTEARVECLLERLSGCATVTKLRVLSRHQQLLRSKLAQLKAEQLGKKEEEQPGPSRRAETEEEEEEESEKEAEEGGEWEDEGEGELKGCITEFSRGGYSPVYNRYTEISTGLWQHFA